jgi:ABC-type multidrug transport system ATPase subunit
MNDVYRNMGVCPQDNLLWETLTPREHLNFYGRLKGLTGKKLTAAVDDVLKSVNLVDVKNKRCGKFSGGVMSPRHKRLPRDGNLRLLSVHDMGYGSGGSH